jgi:hypothetical protein
MPLFLKNKAVAKPMILKNTFRQALVSATAFGEITAILR